MKLVYIAGPFRSRSAWEVEQNIRQAESLGYMVACMGAVPVIPHTMYRFFDGTMTDRFWLEATMELLCKCDAVVFCKRWLASQGSKSEHQKALSMGMPVFVEDSEEFQEKVESWVRKVEDGIGQDTYREVGSE